METFAPLKNLFSRKALFGEVVPTSPYPQTSLGKSAAAMSGTMPPPPPKMVGPMQPPPQHLAAPGFQRPVKPPAYDVGEAINARLKLRTNRANFAGPPDPASRQPGFVGPQRTPFVGPPRPQQPAPVPSAPAPVAAAPQAPITRTSLQPSAFSPPIVTSNPEYRAAAARLGVTPPSATTPLDQAVKAREDGLYDATDPKNMSNPFGPRAPVVDEKLQSMFKPRSSALPMQGGMPDLPSGFQYGNAYVETRKPEVTDRYVREVGPDGKVRVTGATLAGPNVSANAVRESNRGGIRISSGTPEAAARREQRRDSNPLFAAYQQRRADRRDDALAMRRESNAIRAANPGMGLAEAASVARAQAAGDAERADAMKESKRRFDAGTTLAQEKLAVEAKGLADDHAAKMAQIKTTAKGAKRDHQLKLQAADYQAKLGAMKAQFQAEKTMMEARAIMDEARKVDPNADLARERLQIGLDRERLAFENEQADAAVPREVREAEQRYQDLITNVGGTGNPVDQAMKVINAPGITDEQKMETLNYLGMDEYQLLSALDNSDYAPVWYWNESDNFHANYQNKQKAIREFFARIR